MDGEVSAREVILFGENVERGRPGGNGLRFRTCIHNRSARSADKSLVHLFKGGGSPEGKALWPPPQRRNLLAAPPPVPYGPETSSVWVLSFEQQGAAFGGRFCRETGKQPVLLFIRIPKQG